MQPSHDTHSDALLAQAGWPQVADALLEGVSRDLAGRVASLEGMLQLFSFDEGPSPLAPFLKQEVTHLQQVVVLQRLMLGHPEAEPEPISLGESVPLLLELHRRHAGLTNVSVVPDIDAPGQLILPWRLFSRALLCATSVAASEAAQRDRRVDLTIHGDGQTTDLHWTAIGSRRESAAFPSNRGREEGISAVVKALGGSWTPPARDGLPVWRMRLPSGRR